MKKPSLINVQYAGACGKINAPDLKELDLIKRGSTVIVKNNFEKFQVEVTHVNGSTIEGIINETELLHSNRHNLYDRDLIQFHKTNVFAIIE